MKIGIKVLCCLISLLVSSLSAQVTNVLYPVADTHVRNAPGTENSNYGTAGYMYLYSYTGARDFFGYVRFDLSSLGLGTQILDASLTFTKVTTGSGERNDTLTAARFRTLGLLDVTGNTPQDWGELTLTWNNKGAEYVSENNYDLTRVVDFDGAAGNEVVTGGITATISGTNLVNFLNSRLAANGLATFIVDFATSESGRGFGLGTKENSDPNAWPRLTVVIPEPGTISLGVAAVALLLSRRKRAR
ncbi:MAG: DNRLRE domain-containing protein [Verrucomicrobiae bacterium]|nr:DNRLRE domain-containing protein [Verrucomicrobiae bacterium]